MYQTWRKPNAQELQAVFSDIVVNHNLRDEDSAELMRFLCVKTGKAARTVYHLISDDYDPSKIKYSFWLFLNLLAKRDISSIFTPAVCELNISKSDVQKMFGESAFKARGDGFKLPDDIDCLFFNSSYDPCRANTHSISNLTRKEFTNSLSMNYHAFMRKYQKGQMSHIEFKLYLITIGFSADEIGF